MAMPRQAELAGQRFDSRRDVAKARIVDPWRHVQSLDDPIRAKDSPVCILLVTSNEFKTAAAEWFYCCYSKAVLGF